jgi:ribosomal protein S18 acetylase RimI-like enzyme
VADDELGFEIRQIEPGDTLTGLSLGDPAFVALKNFLRRQARPYHNQDFAKTYGAFRSDEPARVIGYVTLVCGQIETEEDAGPAIEPETEYPYDHFPAVKIARLAVDRRYSGQGLGKSLVDFSLGTIKTQICPWVGCRFVVVDAKQASVGFYEKKCGFTMLDTEENRALASPIMFVDLHKV